MNALAKTEDTASLNLFASYAEEMAAEGMMILKFKRGKYLLGADGTEVGSEEEFAAQIDSLTREWVKWQDGQPLDKRTAILAEGERLPPRDRPVRLS